LGRRSCSGAGPRNCLPFSTCWEKNTVAIGHDPFLVVLSVPDMRRRGVAGIRDETSHQLDYAGNLPVHLVGNWIGRFGCGCADKAVAESPRRPSETIDRPMLKRRHRHVLLDRQCKLECLNALVRRHARRVTRRRHFPTFWPIQAYPRAWKDAPGRACLRSARDCNDQSHICP